MPAVTRYIGVARGVELDAAPTVSASTTGLALDLALILDDGAGVTLSRSETLAALEVARGYLAVCPWPPS